MQNQPQGYEPQSTPQEYPQTGFQQGPQGFQQPGYQPGPQGFQQPGYQPGPQGFQQPGYQQGPQGFQQPGLQGYQAYQGPGYQQGPGGFQPAPGFQPNPSQGYMAPNAGFNVVGVVGMGMGMQPQQLELVTINTTISTNFGCYQCWIYFELIWLVIAFIFSLSYVGQSGAVVPQLIIQIAGICIYGYAIQAYNTKNTSAQACVVTCFLTLLILSTIAFVIMIICLIVVTGTVSSLSSECNSYNYNNENYTDCQAAEAAAAAIEAILWMILIVAILTVYIPLCYTWSKAKDLHTLLARRDLLSTTSTAGLKL